MKRATFKIVVIGSGNVASQLAPALVQRRHTVLQIIGRNEKTTNALAVKCSASAVFDLSKLDQNADVVLIAVQDESIAAIAEQLPTTKAIVAHTSGSIGASALLNKSFKGGNFYPLQTFTPGREVDFGEIPILIEANDSETEETLFRLGATLSNKVQKLDSEQRRWLHLAAVFTNNFTNHFYAIAETLCNEKGLSFDLLRPLLKETALKAAAASPNDIQTGPAARGDQKVIETHAEMLAKHPEWQKIYTLLSQSITSNTP